jgi:hypothetical protein
MNHQMAKAKRTKKRTANPLEINIKKVYLPPGTTGPEYLAGLKRALQTKKLPEDWVVNLEWRNPNTKSGKTKHWQSGDWNNVLRKSRSGFATVVGRVLSAAAGGRS